MSLLTLDAYDPKTIEAFENSGLGDQRVNVRFRGNPPVLQMEWKTVKTSKGLLVEVRKASCGSRGCFCAGEVRLKAEEVL